MISFPQKSRVLARNNALSSALMTTSTTLLSAINYFGSGSPCTM